MDIEQELRKLPTDGYIWLNMRATNTEDNVTIHKEFKEYAKKSCDDNYTQALKELLCALKEDYKYSSLYDEIVVLKERIFALEQKSVEKKEEPKSPKEDDDGTF